MASSFLVLELHWFLAKPIFPRDLEILFPSKSSSPFSSEDIGSRQASCTSLENIFLSARFDSHGFKIMSPLVFLDRDSQGATDTSYFVL